MVRRQKHLELRDVLEVFAVEEARHQLVTASHGFDQGFGKPLIFFHLNSRNKPRTLEASNIVIYAFVLFLHERIARRTLGVGIHHSREDIEKCAFSVAAGSVKHEHRLLGCIAGQRIAESLLHVPDCVGIALCDRLQQRIP